MAFIVKKFGGSSVSDAQRIQRVAGIIAEDYRAGHKIIAVLSAQGDTTDDLIEKAAELSATPPKREMDVLLSSGERISVALMAIALEKMGLPAISLTGRQAGILTSADYSAAKIEKIEGSRILRELDNGRIVIVAGFQGMDKYDDVTTLGRGGSDTTAVAIAAALHADRCQIYTDVDGVYTADPRKVPDARKLEEITYDEMLELASLGAQVLHNRSVQMGKRYGVEIEVLSSFTPGVPGTIVKGAAKMEKTKISGVAKDTDTARIAVMGLADAPGIAFRVFNEIARAGINVDIILQSIGRDGTKDISFTVPRESLQAAVSALEKKKSELNFSGIDTNDEVAKVSIVGAGMMSASGIAAMMFEALYDAKVNINMIATSEIKISVLVKEADADRAVSAIHRKFFDE
ncbi:MAG: aspartate kinase [Oscillospiraceae bacterium]|jgi:aspartate kinase|nr:aspartate kinase [Oscillospiraceae bacterium]